MQQLVQQTELPHFLQLHSCQSQTQDRLVDRAPLQHLGPGSVELSPRESFCEICCLLAARDIEGLVKRTIAKCLFNFKAWTLTYLEHHHSVLLLSKAALPLSADSALSDAPICSLLPFAPIPSSHTCFCAGFPSYHKDSEQG